MPPIAALVTLLGVEYTSSVVFKKVPVFDIFIRSVLMKGGILMPRSGGLYLQLYEKLRGQITSGVFPFGSRFPSKRVTAEENGVSLITVEHAYSILCDEGYLASRQRSGYYVKYRGSDFLEPPEASFPLSALPAQLSGDTEHLPFPLYARTVRHILSQWGDRLLQKSPNEGLVSLRHAIRDHLARIRSIHVHPEQIIIGSGAEYLYGLIVQMLGRERVYAVEDPSYSMIQRVYLAQGVTIDRLPMGPGGIRSESLARTEASVLHVTPFRSFPTFVTASASKRHEYISWAQEKHGYIIEDDYDSEFSPSSKAEDTLFSLSGMKHVIYVNTFSKTVAPSIRAGFMVLPADLVPMYHEKAGFMSCSVPVMEQVLLEELLVSGEFVRHINRVRRNRRRTPADS